MLISITGNALSYTKLHPIPPTMTVVYVSLTTAVNLVITLYIIYTEKRRIKSMIDYLIGTFAGL